ncbi:MAG TPA: hypothetical protein VF169_24985 [Albitalea sp.]|uniref:hypothetical protein n=1 Tax=Piscinibacter sp. TaxID=1903157 RepID=UPI002ECFBBF0
MQPPRWKDEQGRNALSIVAGEGADALAEFRRILAANLIGNFGTQVAQEVQPSPEGLESLEAKARGFGHGEWTEAQVDAVARFMEVKGLHDARGADDVLKALLMAMCWGSRTAFDAASAVYASGIGDINKATRNDPTLPPPAVPTYLLLLAHVAFADGAAGA